MRARLNALFKKLDALDQGDAVCANCAAAVNEPWLEIEVIAGRPAPVIPDGLPCLSPGTCALGGVLQVIIEHHRPDDGRGDHEPIGALAEAA